MEYMAELQNIGKNRIQNGVTRNRREQSIECNNGITCQRIASTSNELN